VNYQRSKLAAEAEVRKGIGRGLQAVIVNPAGIIGPHDTSGYARLFRMVHQGKLPGVPPGSLSFCDVREVAKAHVAAAERGRIGELYLLGGANASYVELVRIIGRLDGKDVPSRPSPAWLLKALAAAAELGAAFTGAQPALTREAAAMATRSLFCDCSRAVSELGLTPVPLETMAAACYKWMKSEGRLTA
jgi:nucleoside-diphosphate-sugar epimerase